MLDQAEDAAEARRYQKTPFFFVGDDTLSAFSPFFSYLIFLSESPYYESLYMILFFVIVW